MLIGMVDVIFADVAQPDQARIVTYNAGFFLKNNGWVMISIKANCVDSTAAPEAVFASEIDKLRKDGVKPKEQPLGSDRDWSQAHVAHVAVVKNGVTPKWLARVFWDQRLKPSSSMAGIGMFTGGQPGF
ncbi:unnamed protein product [Effrenium voratum]|nr:unnamed protein product [Effrenium voratum]